ncbi:pyridoxal phosphate-dependent decarboxylase family protein [Anaerococcus sp.]|uniref:pyridoxal phosphate-dependent decarboxylase family protein n=1 Tax=Anaerococcus sp. TaxID=1872515 RepID=UPI0025912621|nr:aminotransferase class V-fold PLP-dependent enzyme [Anaerococcus sp.]MDU3211613.1 aminotransferase class V-fold PLP-dependent enzyme [Anaerococcus sp.]
MNNKFWTYEDESVELALNWAKERTVSGSDPKTTALSAKELRDKVGQTITEDGLGPKKALDIFDTLNKATRSADDPMNFAYIPCAPTKAAVAFDEVVSSANVFGGIWECGAGAIYAENQVVDWIKKNLCWPDEAIGTFVSGGTHGNLSALACARDNAKNKWKEEDRYPNGRPNDGYKLIISKDTHSSVKTIAKVLDVDVLTADTDKNGVMSGKTVEKLIKENEGVFAVVATTGTTNTGSIDHIESISKVCQKYDIWLHIDGAYGGAGILAPSVRDLYKGIENADSFIVDPHKWLFAPYDCCCLVYRSPKNVYQTFSQHAEYLEGVDHSQSNPSDMAIHLSRRTRGLPLWYSLVTYGSKKYSEAVEKCIANARKCAQAIKETDHLELVMEPTLSIVVFKRKGWELADYASWSSDLALEGKLLCIPSSINGEIILRLAFLNPNTDIDKAISIIVDTTK